MKKIQVIAAAAVLCAALASGCSTLSGKLKYIELHSRECGICNRMPKVLEAAAAKYGSYVDVETYGSATDTGAELVEKYKVKKYPANLFLDRQGNVFFRYEGLLDEKAVSEILERKIKAMTLTETAK